MNIYSFFPYSWHVDEDIKNNTHIRIYGLGLEDESICVRVEDFTPYIYLELPQNIKWNQALAQIVCNKIDDILGNQKPLLKELCAKKKLYGVHINEDGERETFMYIRCLFSNPLDIKSLRYKLKRPLRISTLGEILFRMHEYDADPILQFTSYYNIPTSGWVNFKTKREVKQEKLTSCDKEYVVSCKNLHISDSNKITKPKILSFDIEVNSTNPAAIPDPEKPGDKIFQISCVISREGDSKDEYLSYLLSLGDPDQSVVGDDVLIYTYKTEAALLEGFTSVVRDENPNLIAGYNILGFDIPYMINRAKFNKCISEFDKLGFPLYSHAKERTIVWSSSAFKNQHFQFLDGEGRTFVDLLPLIRRDYKFSSYRLKFVAEHFLGETKDPLSVKGIFKCYKIGINKDINGVYSHKARRAMGIVGKYCVQDSALVLTLMNKLHTWAGLTEMAKTCNVPMFALYTQGQQIKVYAQLYKYCTTHDIVVEKDVYESAENERYVGGYVVNPVPGRYQMVVPFDFASMYPNTIIAYNIDYSTLVSPESNIPDNKCHVMEWEDHIGCEHDPKVIRKIELTQYIDAERVRIKKLRDKRNSTNIKSLKKELSVEIDNLNSGLKPYIKERSELNKSKPKFPMCEKRSFRFLKEPMGVLPSVIQGLLDARKHTREVDMVKCKKRITELKNGNTSPDELHEMQSLLSILDNRQLAYKVSANSMYGIMGLRKGALLPFMPGAMCTTYMGRTNIELAAKTIVDHFHGELVYGDTDSNYIHFPQLKTSMETWDYAEYVSCEVNKLFPPPVRLEFEKQIYPFFFILTKKRYMYQKCLRDGVVDKTIGKKGVLLARRDNSKFVRDVYEKVIFQISENFTGDKVISYVIEQINLLCSGCKPISDFIVTKAVGDTGSNIPVPFTNEKGQVKAKLGNYTVPLLSSDDSERQEQMAKKGATNEEDFYLLCLPAQVQLAEKMKMRGQRVDSGTRLEYIVADPKNHTAKQYEKVESAEYLTKHGEFVKIDYLYYLKALAIPLDQVLITAFKLEDFVLGQYKYRRIRDKMLTELKSLFRPHLFFA